MMLIVVLLFASHVLVEQRRNGWTSPPIIFRWLELGTIDLTMGFKGRELRAVSATQSDSPGSLLEGAWHGTLIKVTYRR